MSKPTKWEKLGPDGKFYSMDDDFCWICGNNISNNEATLHERRCGPCYARWQEEHCFLNLVKLILASPNEQALPEAIVQLTLLSQTLNLQA